MLQNRERRTFRAAEWLAYDGVAQRYEERFKHLDWTEVAEIDEREPRVGHLPHPQCAYIKAYLVMIEEGFAYMTQLYKYLSEHPALVWLIGFRLKPAAPPAGVGFDVPGSLPTARHLRRKLRSLDRDTLTSLLKQTVQLALEVIPDLGQTVSIDTKHIYAHVKENNPRAYVNDRFNPARQPRADPDCRLGAKRSTNQTDEQGNAKTKTEWLWGYGSGLVVAQTPSKDALVVAESTQTFERNDVTYALPLLHAAHANLGFAPPNLTADAAFDAWYVYQWSAERDGIAAIALNRRGNPLTVLGEHDYPLCTCNGQEMTPRESWSEDGHREQRFRCQTCGAIRKMIVEIGHLMRLRLNRHAEPYRSLYKQRTATERVNSQANALGIDHPRQRCFQAIARRNTLFYILINLRALQRFHERSLNSSLSSIAA